MASDRIQILGANKDVQTLWQMSAGSYQSHLSSHLNERVVQDEHEGRQIPCPGFTPEKHLANVTDVTRKM